MYLSFSDDRYLITSVYRTTMCCVILNDTTLQLMMCSYNHDCPFYHI